MNLDTFPDPDFPGGYQHICAPEAIAQEGDWILEGCVPYQKIYSVNSVLGFPVSRLTEMGFRLYRRMKVARQGDDHREAAATPGTIEHAVTAGPPPEHRCIGERGRLSAIRHDLWVVAVAHRRDLIDSHIEDVVPVLNINFHHVEAGQLKHSTRHLGLRDTLFNA